MTESKSDPTYSLCNWFKCVNKGEQRPLSDLNENLKKVLDVRGLNEMQLSKILYHTAEAINNGVYGEDKDSIYRARGVVSKHIQKWTDKAIYAMQSVRPPPDTNGVFCIAHMLDAFKKLEMQPPHRLTSDFQTRIPKRIGIAEKKYPGDLVREFKMKDFVSILSSFARLALPMNKAFTNYVSKKIGSSNARDYNTDDQALELLYSSAMIDSAQQAIGNSEYVSLKKTIKKLFDNDSELQIKLYSACNPKPGQDESLCKGQTDACKSRLYDAYRWFWNKEMVKEYPASDENSSPLEHHVSTVFEKFGAKVIDAEEHPVTGKKIDLKHSFNNQEFYTQVDGPTHFLRVADSHEIVLNGRTLFQTQLDTKREPEMTLLRLPYTVFNNHKNSPIWRDILEGIKNTPKGAHLIGNDGSRVSLGESCSTDMSYKDTLHEPD